MAIRPVERKRVVVDGHRSDGEVYRALAPELIRFATGLVGSSDAEDVLAQAVTNALSSPQWREVSDQRAYLFRAVYHEALRLRRRGAMRRTREPVSAVVVSEVTVDRLPRPDVRAALFELSVRQRAVVVLTYWLDLSPSGVGELLGVSSGAVKRHLARARARLREVLDE